MTFDPITKLSSRHEAGFTLMELMATLAMFCVLCAMAVPTLMDVRDSMRLGQGAREVERELQTARLKAVTSNRPIRVRFNCPVANQYRMVELIGTSTLPAAQDTAANRCQESAYPYPAADNSPLTRPNHDGPMRQLPVTVSFGAAASLEFWPDGTVRQENGAITPWPRVASTGTAVTLVKGNRVQTITVNSLGKIALVQ